jgi:putative hemolysin
MSISVEIVLILVLIIANGLFAMSEIAVVSARRVRLQQRADDGDAAAAAALKLAQEPSRFLSAVQIGITLIGILTGAFGGATIAEKLARALETIPRLAPYSETVALAAVVLVITYLSLVLGELVPKRLALNAPERIASVIARPMTLLATATAPLVRLLTASTDLVVRFLRIRPSDEPAVTEEDVRGMLAQGAEAGVFEKAEKDLVAGVFRLADLRAGAVITPRTAIEWLDVEDAPDEIRSKINQSTYAQFPIARGSLDNVIGVVHARDLLTRCLNDQPLDLAAILRPPLFLPEMTPALEVLAAFKSTGATMCLVIDEYGGLHGLVTLTDLLEAVVGDLGYPGAPAQPQATQRADGSWIVDGLITVAELRELLDLEPLPGEDENIFQTLGGFVMHQLGRVPTVTDAFEWGGWRYEVMDMDGQRVDKVLMQQAVLGPGEAKASA